MVSCACCHNSMPDERAEFYKTCINCTDQSTYTGFMVYGHKTAGSAVLIKSSNVEAIRQAVNADRRKR